MPTARLFFALDVPKPTLDALAETQRTLRPFAERFEPRWTRPEQMHLTLKFLGDVATESIGELSQLVAASEAPLAAFERVATFPDTRRARVLVVELKPSDERLADMARQLDERAAAFGVARERRPFRPHLTLARFKQPGNATFLLESAVLPAHVVRFSVLRLYQSTRGQYVPLASAQLAGTSGE
jgi:2'-5' RNA ligase